MSRPIISVEGISKAYRIGLREERPTTLVTAAYRTLTAPVKNLRRLRRLDTYGGADAEDIYWALRDVSFEVAEGEVVGIIGRNGAGKSTLLKILSRITDPTSGRAVLRGRVSSLLEVGTGFHPELTGRENVFLNGTILGMTKREVERKFDEIVEFSGIEKFLDTPIKRYSSGMSVRLAFAVAAHLEPEILIIDEVLAVGDAEFQKKCLGKMKDVARGGRTVLFVSHSISAVRALCQSGVLLSRGQIVHRGPINDVLERYLDKRRLAETTTDVSQSRRAGCTPLIESVRCIDALRQPCGEIHQGEDIGVEITYRTPPGIELSRPTLGVVIKGLSGEMVAGINTVMTGHSFQSRRDTATIGCIVKQPPLVQGQYTFDIYLGNHLVAVDVLEDALTFNVIPGNVYGTGVDPRTDLGHVYLKSEWYEE